ncbi:MAG: rRNA maturation RNase YbeY [Acidobacteria bacterium]|nr:rRNA maturation RNase YbeY [Acidobacteriota bacterium]
MSRMPPDGQRRRRLRVLIADERGRAARCPGLAGWLTRVAPAKARGVLSIALVSDRRIRQLNRRYRRKDSTTDVLSFPANVKPRRTRRPRRRVRVISSVSSVVNVFLGDVVIARGVARRQAKAARHSELTELKILALHGLLHLLGYDHGRDAGRMQRLERRLRIKGGLREGLIERAREFRAARR